MCQNFWIFCGINKLFMPNFLAIILHCNELAQLHLQNNCVRTIDKDETIASRMEVVDSKFEMNKFL